ncbi:MAG: hypothetical protein WDA07_07415 [Leucobacter sp.]
MNPEPGTEPHESPDGPHRPQSADRLRSRAVKPIMVTTAIVGGIALAAAGGSAAFGAAFDLDRGGIIGGLGASLVTHTADAAGVTRVDVVVSAADVTVAFGNVDEAELRLDGPRSDRWQLTRDRDRLLVKSHERFWDFCFGWCRTGGQTVVLTLPRELEPKLLDLDVDLAAGAVTTSGRYDSLGLEMGAGRAELTGEAHSLDLSVGAGSATFDLADVGRADIEVSAGSVRGELTGTAPSDVDLEVSAGSLDLTLPDEIYRVNSEVAVGSLDSGLRTASSAVRTIDLEVAAGRVILTPHS